MNDEWYTPKWVFDALGVTFDIDVCAPVGGTGIVPTAKHYSINDDGLAQDWNGFVWMNPPYSKPTPWIDKFVQHNNGIALVPFSKSKWFAGLWNNDNVDLLALPPNLKFVRPDGSSKQIFMQCVLVGIGEKAKLALQQCSINKVR
jgi:phage N-6-adenine-methyltransferase